MLSVSGLSHHFTGDDLFNNISLQFYPKEKIGVVGRNGCGKTTFLNIIAGKLIAEKGTVSMPADYQIGFLEQTMNTLKNKTLFQEAEYAIPEIVKLRETENKLVNEIANITDYSSEKYSNLLAELEHVTHRLEVLRASQYDEIVEKTLLGLGFTRDDLNRNINEFSGGWVMRLELAKILIARPQIVLLDEPTNYLDIQSIRWLEQYMESYNGIVMVVSHDRSFLDAVCTRTIEITAVKVYDYKGNYSDFETWKDNVIESQKSEQSNINKEIEQVKRFIERFRYKASKAKQVQSRIKKLERLEEIDVEYKDTSNIIFNFPKAPHSGKIVVEGNNISKYYDEKLVFKDLDFTILREEAVAFIGKNGEGKSTLAKIITGNLDFDGNLTIGHNVNIGYFAQNQAELLDKEMSVFETMEYHAVLETHHNIRAILGGFLFKDDDLDKKVKVLSGGEKTRLAIACMLLKPFNLLVMDEPTNHLDMLSKDVLKNALLHFGGTMIIISHDRDFLTGLSDRVFDFHNHSIKQYTGGIEEYLEVNKMNAIDEVSLRNKSQQYNRDKNQQVSENKIYYEERKEIERKRRKLQKQLEEAESNINKCEETLKVLESKMNMVNADADVFEEYGRVKKQMDAIVHQWESAYLELEEFDDKQQ